MTTYRLQNLTIESFETDLFVYGVNNKLEILEQGNHQFQIRKKNKNILYWYIYSLYNLYPPTTGDLTVTKEEQFLFCNFKFSIKSILFYSLVTDAALILLLSLLAFLRPTNPTDLYHASLIFLLICVFIVVISVFLYELDKYLILNSFKKNFEQYFENYVPPKVKVIPIKDSHERLY